MPKPQFKTVLHGDGDQFLRIEVSSFDNGARLDVRQYRSAGKAGAAVVPAHNGFNAPIALLPSLIAELQEIAAKAKADGMFDKIV